MRLSHPLVLTAALAVAVSISTASLAAPALAESLTVTVTDPAGDTRLKAPAYLDIVQAEATKNGENLEFRMDLAGPIPLIPPHLPPGNGQVLWVWGLDTDLTMAPQGTPGASGVLLNPEFVLRVVWDGNAFSGELIDRTPLLTGGDAVFTPLPTTIISNQVSIAVLANAVGNPASFLWDPVTILWSSSHHTTSGWHIVDATIPFWNPSP